MEQEQLNVILEALLFTAGRPMKAKEFAKILELEESAVKKTLDEMLEQKKDSGIVLLSSGHEYQLTTNSKYSPQVKNFLNAELREKLTDATVEVLAIIAYRQPISKAELEAIRGVNSQYSIRNLLMRGLIEKIANPNDARSFLYQTTTEFLMHMGLTSVKDLPEFEKLVEHIKLPQTPALERQETETAAITNDPVAIPPTGSKPQSVLPSSEEIITSEVIENSSPESPEEEEDKEKDDIDDDEEQS